MPSFLAIGGESIQFVKKENCRSLSRRVLKYRLNLLLSSMNIDASQVPRLNFQEIEGKLLGDLTSDKSLPAARRPIKQNSIWQRYSVPSSLFREPQAQDDIPFELRLELVHSCNPGPLGFNRNVVGSLRWIEIEVELPQQAIAKRPGIARLG